MEKEMEKAKNITKKKENKYVEFEGEYLNGERNGKGKEYNINGELNLKENI